jgi:transposase InsO family protein
MAKYGLVSTYTVKQYKVTRSTCNNEPIQNLVNREFNNRELREVIVSDLTYVNVANSWNYICILIDLHGREIIGYAAGKNNDANLVYKAFTTVNAGLDKFQVFHTDRGNEFKNKLIDEVVTTFEIKRSLSAKGCPYDNSPAETFNHILKIECIKGKKFGSLKELEIELMDYINWYNNHRLHGSLDYQTPMEYKEKQSRLKDSM